LRGRQDFKNDKFEKSGGIFAKLFVNFADFFGYVANKLVNLNSIQFKAFQTTKFSSFPSFLSDIFKPRHNGPILFPQLNLNAQYQH
jgi:hypothetical protein